MTFSPRPLTSSRFVGYMRLSASIICFVSSLSSGWKVLVNIKSSLSDYLVLDGFTPCPPAPPVRSVV